MKILLLLLGMLFAGMLTGCTSPVERATELDQRGDAKAAEQLLHDRLADQPLDLDARLMLGRLLLRRNALSDADQLFEKASPEENAQIADVYREAMQEQQDEKLIAAMAHRAIRRTPGVCAELLTIADTRRREGKRHGELLALAGSLEGCAPEILAPLRKWIRELSAKEASALVGATPHFTEEQAREVAIALRDEAARIAGKDDVRALALLDLVARVAPAIGGDLDAVVLRSRLLAATGRSYTPRTSSSSWLLDQYRSGTPEEITSHLMRLVGDALSAYHAHFHQYPVAQDFYSLRGSLSSRYLEDLPATDGWGRPFVYVAAPDGRHARVISGGADLEISAESMSLRFLLAPAGPDIVWESGEIVQR